MTRLRLLIQRLQQQPPLRSWALLLLLFLVFIPSAWVSYQLQQQSQNGDLRLRITGARMYHAGKVNPYEHKWVNGDDHLWFGPTTNVRDGINGVTITPFFLWILQPLAAKDFCTIRTISWILEELFLFLTLLLCSSLFSSRLRQLIFIAVAIPFFLFTRNWMVHIYVGQVYVFYAFFIALAAWITVKKKQSALAGSVLLITALLRPFFVTGVLAFHQWKKKRSYITFGITAMVILVLVLIEGRFTEWKHYNQAMKLYAMENPNSLHTQAIDTPKTIEPCLMGFAPPEFPAGSLFQLQHYLYKAGYDITNPNFYMLLFAVVLLIAYAIAYKRNIFHDAASQVVFACLIFIIGELLTPATRNPYNMVQWLPVVALIVAKGNRNMIALMITGLLLNHDIPVRLKFQRELGEALLIISSVYFLLRKVPKVQKV